MYEEYGKVNINDKSYDSYSLLFLMPMISKNLSNDIWCFAELKNPFSMLDIKIYSDIYQKMYFFNSYDELRLIPSFKLDMFIIFNFSFINQKTNICEEYNLNELMRLEELEQNKGIYNICKNSIIWIYGILIV